MLVITSMSNELGKGKPMCPWQNGRYQDCSLELLSKYPGLVLFLWRRSLEAFSACYWWWSRSVITSYSALSVLIPYSYLTVVVTVIVAAPSYSGGHWTCSGLHSCYVEAGSFSASWLNCKNLKNKVHLWVSFVTCYLHLADNVVVKLALGKISLKKVCCGERIWRKPFVLE